MFDHLRVESWPCRVACLAFVLAAVACGSNTTIEQTWKAPDVPAANMHNVATLYVSRDVAMRRTVEDTMAQKLASAGVHAVPAYSLLTDNDLKDRAVAKAKLVANGIDGVVAIRLVSQQQQLQYTPATFDGYWGAAWPNAYDAGYLTSETVVRFETNAFSLTDNKLVWSALSKTVDPANTRSEIGGVTSVVATQLEKQQVVASAPKSASR